MEKLRPEPETKLPASFEFYRQAASWLATLSLGAIAFVLPLYKGYSHHIYLTILFFSTLIFFSLSSILSVFFYFQLTYYTNQINSRDRSLILSEASDISQDDKSELKEEAQKFETNRLKTKNRYHTIFNALKFSFMIAICSMALLTALSFYIDQEYEAIEVYKYSAQDVKLYLIDIKSKQEIWQISDRSDSISILKFDKVK